MKKFIPNQDAIIEEQLRDEDHKRDLKWVRERLEKAEKKLSELEYEWQSSGYGSRSAITKLENEVRLCRLALRGSKRAVTAAICGGATYARPPPPSKPRRRRGSIRWILTGR